MTIQIQPPSGPIADATEEQLAAIRDGLSVPSHAQVDARFGEVYDHVATIQQNLAAVDADTWAYVQDTRDGLRVEIADAQASVEGQVATLTGNVDSAVSELHERIDAIPVSETLIVSASRNLTPDDDGQILEVTAGGVTLTVPNTGLAADFACAVNPLTGTVSVASAGVATLNGDTAILTRASASNPMFAIVRRASVANGYTVTGG